MRRGAPSGIATTTGLPFPACVEEAFVQVTKQVRLVNHGRNPNRNISAKLQELQVLIDNDIFCLKTDRKSSKLNPLQQLQLLNLFCQYFSADDPNKYHYFEAIFLGREGESGVHEYRITVLYKLASFALQYPVLGLFVLISQWLSKIGGGKLYAEELCSMLVDHFVNQTMYQFLLPLEETCPEFTVFFISFAPQSVAMNKSLAAIVASYITKNISYALKEFREAAYLAEMFAKKSFPKLLAYDMKPDVPERDILLFHDALLSIIDQWNGKVKDHHLDIDLLLDHNFPWSKQRTQLIRCAYNNISGSQQKHFSEKLYGCNVPNSYQYILEVIDKTSQVFAK